MGYYYRFFFLKSITFDLRTRNCNFDALDKNDDAVVTSTNSGAINSNNNSSSIIFSGVVNPPSSSTPLAKTLIIEWGEHKHHIETSTKSPKLELLFATIQSFKCGMHGYLLDEKLSYFQQILNKNNEQCYSNSIRKRGNVKTVAVDRDSLIGSTMKALKSFDDVDWRMKWRIEFKNEPGVDCGGVRKDFFTAIGNRLFSIDNELKLFLDNGKGLLVFNPNCKNMDVYYEFAGKFLAKLLYDNCIYNAKTNIPLKFTETTFKRIAGYPLNLLKDFECEDPELYKSKISFLQNAQMSELDALEQMFIDEEVIYKQSLLSTSSNTIVKEIELKPKGKKTHVTLQNRQEFILLFCKYRLETRIQRQVSAFLKGFHSIISLETINIFEANDLSLLLNGMHSIDVEDWRLHTTYEGPSCFSENAKEIQWFWSFVKNLTTEEQGKLLQFMTGCSQVPVDGFSSMQCVIHRKSIDATDKLPTSHTCFNRLELPPYTSYEKLSQSLMTALQLGNDAFGSS